MEIHGGLAGDSILEDNIMYTAQGLIELGFEFEKDFATYAVDGGDNKLVWNSGSPQPSVADCEAAHTQWANKEYQRTRADAYPSIGDQLDMLWHAIDGDATLKSNYADFHTALKAVKDANPK